MVGYCNRNYLLAFYRDFVFEGRIMEKQIIINESTTLKFVPDTTVLSLTVDAEDEKYNVAVELANDYLSEISDTLAEVGVLRDDIKTEGFNVRPKYERVEHGRNGFKNVLVGYSCTQTLVMEFGCDAEFLSNVISALSTLDCVPDISLSFKLNNTKDAEAELIQKLSEQASFKAHAFCDSLGVRLGELLSVDYRSGSREYMHGIGSIDALCCSADSVGSFTADIVPKEITLNENAKFVWGIEP